MGPYAHPTKSDTCLYDISPRFCKDEIDGRYIIRGLASRVTAFVLVVDLCYRSSFEYLQNLAKLMAEQPALLVMHWNLNGTIEMTEEEVQNLAI
jgi:hypothetical protein